MNTNTHHWLWALVLVVTLVLGLTYGEYTRSIGARDAQISASKKEVEQVKLAMAERQKDFEKRFQDLEEQKQQVKTAPQAIRIIHDNVPMATPLVINPASPPDAPSALLDKDQLVEFSKYTLSCKQCELERGKQVVDLKDKDAIIKKTEEQRDAALRQAKGGSFVQRVGRNSKWFVAGAVVGVIAKFVLSK